MAITPLCAKLFSGQDAACVPLVRKYHQQVVLIDRSDIEEFEITKTDYESETPTCAYNVTFTLKEGATGHRFTGPQNGSSYFGRYNKSVSDLGFVQYTHEAQMLLAGVTEGAKCIQEALDKGSVVAVYQLMDGTVEVFGIENGLSTGDYTNSIQENGGATALILTSNEDTPEGSLPLVYKSAVPGEEGADFDAAFANPAS